MDQIQQINFNISFDIYQFHNLCFYFINVNFGFIIFGFNFMNDFEISYKFWLYF